MSEEQKDCIVEVNKTFHLRFRKKGKRLDEAFYIIYKTVNLLKGENEPTRFYVGQHIQYNIDPYEFDGYLGSGTILEKSIEKYGKENFKRETLEVCNSLKHMNERELFWIEELKANFRKYPESGGINLSSNNGINTDESIRKTKEKLSDGRMCGDKNPMFGRHHTEEVKRKQSERMKGNTSPNKGKPMPEETKIKLSKSTKGKRTGKENYFYGQHHTEETKRKISEANTGKPNSNKDKPITEDQKIKISKTKTGQKHTEETKKKLSEKNSGDKNSKYLYVLSTGENYWDRFSENERCDIRSRFSHQKKDEVIYKDIIIIRILKQKIEYEYVLSNGENYKTYFSTCQKTLIKEKFLKTNSDVIEYIGITITRIIKNNKGEIKNG